MSERIITKAAVLGAPYAQTQKDPAADGMEVFIIRQTKMRSEGWYHAEVLLAAAKRAQEEERILEAERKFVRDVEAILG